MTTLPEQARALAKEIEEEWGTGERSALVYGLTDALDIAHADAAAMRGALERVCAAADKAIYHPVDQPHLIIREARGLMQSTTAGRDMLERVQTLEHERDEWHGRAVNNADDADKYAKRAWAAEARLATAEADARRKALEECASVANANRERWKNAGGFHDFTVAAGVIETAIRALLTKEPTPKCSCCGGEGAMDDSGKACPACDGSGKEPTDGQ